MSNINFNQQYPMTSMYGTKSMKIKKFILQQTGTYNQQWHRPFNSGLNGQMMNNLLESVDRNKMITASALTGMANQFLHPSATPESHIAIPNGWNEKRIRFFLEVETESQIGAIQTEYIVGYTDYMGIANSLAIDPQMRFCINAINSTRTTKQVTPIGTQMYQNVIDSSHVIANNQYVGVYSKDQVYRMRPEDVFTQIDSIDLRNEAAYEDFTDARTLVTTDPIKSKRSNAVAPVYVASILDSYLQSARSDTHGESRIEVMDNARQAVRSNKAVEDPFMAFIKSRNLSNAQTFCYADLMALDPNVTLVTAVIDLAPTQRSTVHQAGQTADWGSTNGETVFATSMSQSLPGYMLQFCINKLHFMSTNRDIGSVISSKIVDVKSFMTGVNLAPYVQSMLFKIENELLRDLTYNNQMDFMIDMRCDLLGETWINVSINNGPLITYVTPSFCDALMTPVTTNNLNTLAGVASDFDSIITQLGDSNNAGTVGISGSFGNI